jgi:hypothetical protein
MIDILNGKVPDPAAFGGKTELWQLTPVEKGRLVETYTGNAYIATGGMQDPAAFIDMVVNDYSDTHAVQVGDKFVTSTIDEDGNASVAITDEPASGGTPFVYSVKMSNGTVVPVVGRQTTQDVLAVDGSYLGKVVFDVDSNGQVNKSFITKDNFKMDYDTFQRWLDTKGVKLASDANGNVQANINPEPMLVQLFTGSEIRKDPVYGGAVSATEWNGVAEGQGADAARRILGKRIADNIVSGAPGSITVDQATGNLIVADPEAALRDYGINSQDLETVINANTPGSDYNGVKTAIGDALFRVSERTERFNPPALKDGEKSPDMIGMETAAQLEAKRRREENAARLLAERKAAGQTGFDPITALQALFGIGAGKGPRELELERMRAEAARAEAERRANEVRDNSIRPGDTPVEPEDIGYDPGTKPSGLPSTVSKDPVASFFLRNVNIINPEAPRFSLPSGAGATKISSAPVVSTVDFSATTQPKSTTVRTFGNLAGGTTRRAL